MLSNIFENNEKWIAKKLENDPQYFEKLGSGQSPKYLYIGCSDSRVTAEEIMGLGPGELFVHRNVANMVVGTDANMHSVLHYAVEYLKVEQIIIVGHYACGGIKAAMQPVDLGVLNPWLRNIRDVYRIHIDELDAIKNEEKRYDRLVELNVQEQCVNLIKTAEVQKAFREKNLRVHGWVFDVHTGKLIDLKIDFKEILENIMKVYKII